MDTPCARRRTTSSAAIRIVLVFACITLCVAWLDTTARAEDPDTARTLWESGRAKEAFTALEAFLLSEPTEPAPILAAARLAAEMKDLDLVERVQGRAEIAGQTATDPRLELALGISYLAHAEIRLQTGVSSPTISFLFADAEALAKKLALEHAGTEFETEGRLLQAKTRRALGDVEGALVPLRKSDAATNPSIARLRGQLLYERALEKGLGADGRPTEAGQADLETALELLAPFEDAALTCAWAAHRLGRLEPARDHYLRALARTPNPALPLRGLKSLYAGRPKELRAALETAAVEQPKNGSVLDALAISQLATRDARASILTLDRRIALDEADPAGWYLGGGLFFAMKQWEEARKHLAKALELDPTLLAASRLMERTAQAVAADAPDRAVEIYRELTTLRPKDPVIWNNLGFLLRELAAPYTTMSEGAIQTLKADAPERARWYLTQSVDAYREAVRRVPEDHTELDANLVWIYAGIVNDYGLMLHYFTDVRDLGEAERLYLRALRMTDYGYKDTYVPNLRRLYGIELEDRALRWYRVAEEARYAQMKEVPRPGGGFDLQPDEAKRALAERDAKALRARLYEQLEEDAGADGDPWPPTGD